MHVFCIFVIALVQSKWAHFTWKGTLEIHSLLSLYYYYYYYYYHHHYHYYYKSNKYRLLDLQHFFFFVFFFGGERGGGGGKGQEKGRGYYNCVFLYHSFQNGKGKMGGWMGALHLSCLANICPTVHWQVLGNPLRKLITYKAKGTQLSPLPHCLTKQEQQMLKSLLFATCITNLCSCIL